MINNISYNDEVGNKGKNYAGSTSDNVINSNISIDDMISEFGEQFLYQKEISNEDMLKIYKQFHLYKELSQIVVGENPIKIRRKLGLPEFAEGTLIHGTQFNVEVLQGIKEKGVISGNFLGITEEAETFYCADFFRMNKAFSCQDYFNKVCERENIGSFTTRIRMESSRLPHKGNSSVGIIFSIENADIRELLKLDVYREGREAMKDVVTNFPIDLDNMDKVSRISAIPVGIPANFISAIVVGGKMSDEQKIRIREIFGKDMLIIDINGNEI